MLWIIVAGIGALALGIGAGLSLQFWLLTRTRKAAAQQVEQLLEEAQRKKKEILLEAKDEAIRVRNAAEAELREQRSEIQRRERRLVQREEVLERKLEAAERREQALQNRQREAEHALAQAEELRQKEIARLEAIAGMTTAEAKEALVKSLEAEAKEEAERRAREFELRLKEEAQARAREAVAMAIQRLATDVVSETTVSVVPLPNDEMKGRLIGREGRNIRALEHATGVELIIDDTPEAVTLSCFDPVRREVARLTLERLIQDGRIHPARIEEVAAKARDEVEATIKTEGEQAVFEGGVKGIHPELVKLLGRLKYRYSYGQNVLLHSKEVAYLAGMLADEIGAQVEVAKKAGLLHDIGKGVDFEREGSHAQIGSELLQKYGVPPQVIQAVADHHNEGQVNTIEGFLVAAADAISGARPGARRESLEYYLKRLEALEKVANSFPGVEKSFAIRAGREVRILVKPDQVDDAGAAKLARDIAKKVEEALEYPGQVQVTVIRETRSVEYAK